MSEHVPGQLALLDDQAVAEAHDWPDSVVVAIRTNGRTEYGVQCGGCREMHRHVTPGIKKGPCGAFYPIPEPEYDPDPES